MNFNNEVKFSIITPVYNSFGLMENYFKSLERQKIDNFEVIIIDDYSTDDSYLKLLEYTQKTKLNLKIIKAEENLGPGNARNIGINRAIGEWITFIDNDDWVEDNFLASILEVIEKEEVDCIVYDYYIKHKDKEPRKEKSLIGQKQEFISKENGIINIKNHTFGKFYKLKNIKNNNILFPKIRRCEDVTFTTLAISISEKIYYLEKSLYFYFQRKKSLSNNSKLDEKDMVIAFSILQERLEEKYPNEIKEKSVKDLLYGGLLMMCKANKKNKDIKEYINRYEKRYQDWEKTEIIKNLGIAKYIFLKLAKYRLILGLKILAYIHSKLI